MIVVILEEVGITHIKCHLLSCTFNLRIYQAMYHVDLNGIKRYLRSNDNVFKFVVIDLGVLNRHITVYKHALVIKNNRVILSIQPVGKLHALEHKTLNQESGVVQFSLIKRTVNHDVIAVTYCYTLVKSRIIGLVPVVHAQIIRQVDGELREVKGIHAIGHILEIKIHVHCGRLEINPADINQRLVNRSPDGDACSIIEIGNLLTCLNNRPFNHEFTFNGIPEDFILQFAQIIQCDIVCSLHIHLVVIWIEASSGSTSCSTRSLCAFNATVCPIDLLASSSTILPVCQAPAT